MSPGTRRKRRPDAIAPCMLSCLRQGGARNLGDSHALRGLVRITAHQSGTGVEDGVRLLKRRKHGGEILIIVDMIACTLAGLI